jgi:hypothetical protein
VKLHLKRLRCEECGKRFRPAVAFLACLKGVNLTGKLRQACTLAGASWPYETAAGVLKELCGAEVSPETVRRMTVHAGEQELVEQVREAEAFVSPTARGIRIQREKELAGPIKPRDEGPELLMVGLDGGWIPGREQRGGMEGKVGVVATETEDIGNGRRRLSERRYVATFGDSEELGLLTYQAASELGGEDASRQVVVGDGANWIKEEAGMHFPWAVKILDWPHVARAVYRGVRAALPGKERQKERSKCSPRLLDWLWEGKTSEAVDGLKELRPDGDQEPVPALEETIRYIDGQRDWMGDYAAWQAEGYPIGSGLVERAVELVINRRLKRQGMRWLRNNAGALVALRVATINHRWLAPPKDA